MPDSMSFDPEVFDRIARKMRIVADRSSKEMTETVWQLGEMLSIRAEVKAGAHSSKVAATIRMQRKSGEADVIVGNRAVPLGRLYEIGNIKRYTRTGASFNRSRKGTSGSSLEGQLTFWHPVYGHRKPGAFQRRYPSLQPALKEMRPRIKRELEGAERRMLEPLRTIGEGDDG